MGSKLHMSGINSLIRHVSRLEEEEIAGVAEAEERKFWEALKKSNTS